MVTLTAGKVTIITDVAGVPNLVVKLPAVSEDRLVELNELLILDAELEVVVRRRPRSPQEIQSEIEHSLLPEPMTKPGEEPWKVIPKAKKVKKSADEPETQPEPEKPAEPVTAQLVEEFGSWG